MFIKIIPPVPQICGQYITAIGESMNDSSFDRAFEGAWSFFALHGNNAGPYCIIRQEPSHGFIEVTSPSDDVIQFTNEVVNLAEEFSSESANLLRQETERWLSRKGFIIT